MIILLLIFTVNSDLVITSDCICPDSNAIYECTVTGRNEGFTVWQGTALNCSSNEITLLHRLFTSAEGTAVGICNQGSIVGRRFRVENWSFYTSQLSVTVSSKVIGKSISCLHDDTDTTLVSNLTINITTGISLLVMYIA